MFISFGTNQISIRSLATEAELINLLAEDNKSLLLGQTADRALEFHLAKIHFKSSDREPFCIGICSEGHGLKPHLLTLPESDLI